MKRLSKSRKDSVITGVCGGIANYFGIDPIIVRLVWFFSGIGIVPYIICAICLPYDDEVSPPSGHDYSNQSNDSNRWQ